MRAIEAIARAIEAVMGGIVAVILLVGSIATILAFWGGILFGLVWIIHMMWRIT